MSIDSTIFVKKYDEAMVPVNDREIWRYAGYISGAMAGRDCDDLDSSDEVLGKLLDEVKKECQGIFGYRVCYRKMPVTRAGEGLTSPLETASRDLQKCLESCDECIMLAATIGHELDRLINRYQRFEPTKALFLQAYGAERVESLLDVFCEDLAAEYGAMTPRFSPGYGDLPLTLQTDFFRILDINRQIGVALGESLLMRPSKSVTAIAGIISAN